MASLADLFQLLLKPTARITQTINLGDQLNEVTDQLFEQAQLLALDIETFEDKEALSQVDFETLHDKFKPEEKRKISNHSSKPITHASQIEIIEAEEENQHTNERKSANPELDFNYIKLLPHLEELFYQDLKNLNLTKEKNLLSKLEHEIETWVELHTLRDPNPVLIFKKNVLLSVLRRIDSEQRHAKSKVLEQEKIEWTNKFLRTLNFIMNDTSALAYAFNKNKSIKKDNEIYTRFDEEELQIALSDIHLKKHDTYALHSPERMKENLLDAGLHQSIVEAMGIMNILKYDAAIDGALRARTDLEAAYHNLIIKDQKDFKDNEALEIMDYHNEDKKQFKHYLIQCSKPHIEFHYAKVALQETLKREDMDLALKAHGKKVLKEVIDLKDSAQTAFSMYELTNVLKVTHKTITKPSSENAFACSSQAQKCLAKPTGKKLGGILLGLAGVGLILGSIALGIFSFGLSAPVTIGGITVGASLLASSAAVLAVAGSISVVGGSCLFAEGKKESQLGKELKQFSSRASKAF